MRDMEDDINTLRASVKSLEDEKGQLVEDNASLGERCRVQTEQLQEMHGSMQETVFNLPFFR